MAASEKDAPQFDARVRAELVQLAAQLSGHRPEVLSSDALLQATAPLRLPTDELLRRLSHGEPQALSALMRGVSVGETYFFRQAEHFDYLVSTLIPRWQGEHRHAIRVWCAGCATGEEVYSVAACLQATLAPRGVSFEVLGTDLVEANVSRAREGKFGSWSLRASSPLLYPVGTRTPGGGLDVAAELRQAVHFERHNLLDPAPVSEVDLIFCRNVLLYFSAAAQARVLSHLRGALRMGGVAVFGTMDLFAPPADLTRESPSELNAFVRERAPAAPPGQAAVEVSPAVPTRSPDPVEVHLSVLKLLDRDQLDEAGRLLESLAASSPDYLPGILERALFAARNGQRARAAGLMRLLILRTEGLVDDELVEGPERLTVSFYRASAEAYLARTE